MSGIGEPKNKLCEVCGEEIPGDFVNLLCVGCYNRQVKEIAEKQLAELQEQGVIKNFSEVQVLTPVDEPSGKAAENWGLSEPRVSTVRTALTDSSVTTVQTALTSPSVSSGITDHNYQENPEMEDKDQVQANLSLFLKHGLLLWHPTRLIYEFIKNYCIKKSTSHPQYPKFIWKPTIVDVGCGCGIGSNILSQEADFVWGIDKNEMSVKFAKQAFTRVKNGIYYNAQVSFDQIDIINNNRETMKFDIVCAIEVIEHINDYRTFLKQLTKFDTQNPNNPTEYFISTPNRNNKHIQKDRPYNKYHVREFTSQEFYNVLSEFFKDIEFFSAAGEPAPVDTNHTPLLAKCRQPKI